MSVSYLYLFIGRYFNCLVNRSILAIIIIVFAVLTSSNITAQAMPGDGIQNEFINYQQHHLQEKIFVHTDKVNYLTGEVCWFKIYNVDGYFHRPLNLCKVAYVEISDKNNKPVLQAKIALQHGTGDGSFYLPVTVATGNYKMRAYTNLMKNEGADYFFEKKIAIINIGNNQPYNAVAQINNYSIGFFPEGGNLVADIKTKVGFQITDQSGKGTTAEGVLVNEKGDSVTTFHTLKFGIGNFSFTPLAGATYKAIVKLPGGEKIVKQLPATYSSGYVTGLQNTGKAQIKVSVKTNGINNTVAAGIFLLVHTRNVIKAVKNSNIQNGEAVFFIDDSTLGEGVSRFTVFNESRQPVCERLFFKRPEKRLQIAVTTNQPAYELRQKINVNLNVTKVDGTQAPAGMSMAVYRVDSLNTVEEENINSYLFLSADISGTVESPEYYFTAHDSTALAATDNLMLTQGWRRFKWETVLLNKAATLRFLPEINGHIITGKITPLKPGLPVEDISAYLSVTGTPGQFQTSTADKDGNVKFEMKNFYGDGGGEIIVQTNNQKDSFYRVDIDQPFFPGYYKNPLPLFDFNGKKDALLKGYISTQVQNTFLYNKINQVLPSGADTNSFYLKPDAVYLLDNYVRFTTLDEVLTEYVPEVNVRKHNGNFYLPVFDEVHRYVFELSKAPLLLIDGLPVFDFNKLMAYDPLKIRKLEVMSRKYYLGGNSFNGIVNFNTYKGNLDGFEIDPRATVLDYEGLQLQREFYAPEYNTPLQRQSHLPDFRNLLYWSPKISTTSTGKTQLGFYTSDVPGKYAIIVQGLGEDGTAGSAAVFFEVKKNGAF